MPLTLTEQGLPDDLTQEELDAINAIIARSDGTSAANKLAEINLILLKRIADAYVVS